MAASSPVFRLRVPLRPWRPLRTAVSSALSLVSFLLLPPALAQSTHTPQAEKYSQQALEAFEKNDYPAAAAFLRKQIDADPNNFVPRYNLACALAMEGDGAAGMDALVGALERGFVDLRQLKADPYLAPLRPRPEFENLLTNWSTVLERHRDATLAAARTQFDGPYTPVQDEALRLSYLSAFDQRSFELARAEIDRLAEWGRTAVFRDQNPHEDNDPWVVVILPARKDFIAWLLAAYGPDAINGMNQIGGAYDHDAKRLVTQDLGSGLRHEFFHVLHWRSNTRLGITHAPWVQEGLCSLPEDYDLDQDGHIQPATSWRTNISKRLEKSGLLMPIEKLAALDRARFISTRPLAMYAQARTVFLYLYRKDKLADWYAAYNRTFEKDPTGVAALTQTFGKTMPEINKDFRAFVRALPAVPEEIEAGKASLGIEVEAGSGDGLVVLSVVGSSRRDAQGRALIKGDVVTSIDNRPTREMAELVRVLSTYNPGDTVEVGFRRGSKHSAVTWTLTPK